MKRNGSSGVVLLCMVLALGAASVSASGALAEEPRGAGAAHGHGDMPHGHGGTEHGRSAPMESLGDRIFSGIAGPWSLEARLIDMKAQLEKSGVSAKAIGKLRAKHHLMVILSDPKTGKPAEGISGEVAISGPTPGASSKVELVAMGGHIGSDVSLPVPGKYSFRVVVNGPGGKGSAKFDFRLK